ASDRKIVSFDQEHQYIPATIATRSDRIPIKQATPPASILKNGKSASPSSSSSSSSSPNSSRVSLTGGCGNPPVSEPPAASQTEPSPSNVDNVNNGLFLFIHSFISSFISLVHSFTYSFIHIFIHSFIPLLLLLLLLLLFSF